MYDDLNTNLVTLRVNDQIESSAVLNGASHFHYNGHRDGHLNGIALYIYTHLFPLYATDNFCFLVCALVFSCLTSLK